MAGYTSFDSLLSGSRSRSGSREETPESHHSDVEEVDSKTTQLAQDTIPDSQPQSGLVSFGLGGSGSGVSNHEETTPMQSKMVSFGFGGSKSGVSDDEETTPIQTHNDTQLSHQSKMASFAHGSGMSDDGTTDLPESNELTQHEPTPKIQDSQQLKL